MIATGAGVALPCAMRGRVIATRLVVRHRLCFGEVSWPSMPKIAHAITEIRCGFVRSFIEAFEIEVDAAWQPRLPFSAGAPSSLIGAISTGFRLKKRLLDLTNKDRASRRDAATNTCCMNPSQVHDRCGGGLVRCRSPEDRRTSGRNQGIRGEVGMADSADDPWSQPPQATRSGLQSGGVRSLARGLRIALAAGIVFSCFAIARGYADRMTRTGVRSPQRRHHDNGESLCGHTFAHAKKYPSGYGWSIHLATLLSIGGNICEGACIGRHRCLAGR